MAALDIVIIGGGMAGASAAYEMAAAGSVLLLEREAQPGYHTTGRSAALFAESYGNAPIRALTVGSRGFYQHPPPDFTATPLLSPRGVLMLARADQVERLELWLRAVRAITPDVHRIAADEVRARVPVLRPGYAVAGAVDAAAMDIDVHALHNGYLRGIRARGGQVVTDAEVTRLVRTGGAWEVETNAGSWRASVVVNAAGAWADVVAGLAGAAPSGLTPLRRTALIVEAPPGVDPAPWPQVIDIDEQFYFKPDAGRLLMSPADETPMTPCDVQPEELDIAICIDRVQQAADLPVRRVVRAWAGLRSFVADRTPVVGFDPATPGFFWLAGQGGYGIQTGAAMGRLAAALVGGREVPADLAALGVDAGMLAPGRVMVPVSH